MKGKEEKFLIKNFSQTFVSWFFFHFYFVVKKMRAAVILTQQEEKSSESRGCAVYPLYELHMWKPKNLSSSVGNEVVHEMQFKWRDVPCVREFSIESEKQETRIVD